MCGEIRVNPHIYKCSVANTAALAGGRKSKELLVAQSDVQLVVDLEVERANSVKVDIFADQLGFVLLGDDSVGGDQFQFECPMAMSASFGNWRKSGCLCEREHELSRGFAIWSADSKEEGTVGRACESHFNL